MKTRLTILALVLSGITAGVLLWSRSDLTEPKPPAMSVKATAAKSGGGAVVSPAGPGSQVAATAGSSLTARTTTQRTAGSNTTSAPPVVALVAQSRSMDSFDPAKAEASGVWYHPDLPENEVRARMVRFFSERATKEKQRAENWARQRGLPVREEKDGHVKEIMRLDEQNMPVYYTTSNVDGAKTTAASQIRNTTPYNVNGTNGAKGFNIGEWDGGSVRATHQEFTGSRITNKNSTAALNDHATHVAGTLVARGADAKAQGMAPAANILSYDSINDLSEMTLEAATSPVFGSKILVSNHSYGRLSGWSGNTFNGTLSDLEDRAFGQYGSGASQLDSLCFNAPYYLPFWSAGNDRNNGAPANGTAFIYIGTRANGTTGQLTATYNSATHPPGDGVVRGGYGTIGTAKTAKNLMSIGAVTAAVDVKGVRDITKAQMSAFSCWGPTDDGRIKPDVVDKGVSVYSPISTGDKNYDTYNGTSMASPNACGSALLLQELYTDKFSGEAMRAATLKALILHTADDILNPGPDYQSGWGLINVKTAADLIIGHKDAPANKHMIQSVLTSTAASEQFMFDWNGAGPVRVTLCWTDPAGTAQTGLNAVTSNLVNDLDVRISGPGGIVLPYILNPASPASNATTGDNVRDNVEQIYIAAPQAGTYTVTVNHKGSLSGGQQAYSLIQSGLRSDTPVIVLSTSSIPVITAAATNAASMSFTIRNSGARTLAYTITDDASWMSVSPATGSATTETDTINLNFSTTSLLAGAYVGRIRATAPGAAPQELIVRLKITGSSVPLAQAVDLPAITMTNAGSAWFGQTADSYDSVHAGRSGPVGNNQESTFFFNVTGPGTVSFWWRSDSEANADYLKFEIDGVMSQQISGNTSWAQVNVPIADGVHKLGWKYKKDPAIAVGGDAGFVDQIMFVQSSPILEVSTNEIAIAADLGVNPPTQSFEVWNEGGGVLNYTATEASTWMSIAPASGSSSGEFDPITITFNVTGLKAGTYTGRVAVTPTKGTPRYVDVRLVVLGNTTLPLATALDYTPTGSWSTNSAPATQGWFGQAADAFDKTDCARSGTVVPDSQNSSLIATVNGPATISFYWRVDCEPGYDKLVFRDGGTDIAFISGLNQPWQQYTYSLSAGPHTLFWKYSKDDSQARGLDCGFLDKVVVGPATPQVSVTPGSLVLNSTGGNSPAPEVLQISNTGGGTLTYTLSSNQGWCFISNNKGTAKTETDNISINFDTRFLAAGDYAANIRVDGGTGGVVDVPVTLTVLPGNFTVATIPGGGTYTQSFTATTLPTAANGWSFYSSNEGRVAVVAGALRMDDRVPANFFSLNEATLHANLQGLTGVTLSFKNRESGDENDRLPDTFTGHTAGDGVSISADGVNWHTVDFLDNADGTWTTASIDLDDAIAAAAISFTADFQIKFQQYDDSSWPNDGFEFDDVSLSLATAVDDHGNTITAATPVNPTDSKAGKLEVVGDQDFFRFSIPATTTISIYTTGTLDAMGDLFDANGNLLLTNNDGFGVGKNFLMQAKLEAGTYYVRVRGWNNAKGTYTMLTSATSSVPLVTLARPAADWAPLAYTSFVPVGYLAEMSGLLKQGQGPSLRVLGHMSFKGTHTGPFTGKVYWEGVSYSLAGTFAGGTYTGSVTRTGKPPLSVSLGFFYNGATPDTGEWRVHGQVSDGVNTADAVILENFDWNATNHMGTYTIAIPGEDNGSPTEPQGSAYGSLVINNKGDGTLKLTLPDGTPTVSLPVYLSNQPTGGPECAFYIPVGTGFIAGEFRLRDEAGVSDLDGYVNWRKLPATTGSYYLGGFNLNRSMLGCRFATLANLPDLPGVLTTAQAQFFGGNLSYVPGVRLFSWSSLDKLAGLNPGETWTFSVSAATTAITGTYKHTATGSTFKFGGSIFQKQSKVAGHLLGVQQSGSMSMTP